LAAPYLQDAADLGHSSAQAIVKRFSDVVGYKGLPEQDIRYCLAAMLLGDAGPAREDK
jgi:hypothetical protein